MILIKIGMQCMVKGQEFVNYRLERVFFHIHMKLWYNNSNYKDGL